MDSDIPKPAQLPFETVWTRRYIIASYWIVVLLAVPLWWKTTSIDRLSLPASRVDAQQGRELVFPVDIQLQQSSCRETTDLSTLRREVLQVLDASGLQGSSGIRINGASSSSADAYSVDLRCEEEEAAVQGRSLSYPISDNPSSHLLALTLGDMLATLLTPYTTLRGSRHEDHAVKYSPRYRLAFTLLNEDASTGIGPLSWKVEEAIHKHVSPILEKLSELHNFIIESQVQYHAPLAFEPTHIAEDGQDTYGLTHEDLTVFINSAEWTLSSSVSNDPVLHFVLFVPSARHSPLHIVSPDGGISPSNSFILPQWGGIVLLNLPLSDASTHLSSAALDDPFAVFRHQLTSLLGVPPLPPHVRGNDSMFSNWQLDALVRRRAVENAQGAQETLKSIVRLVQQIDNMPVGQDVKGDVQEALAALEQMYRVASSSSALALDYSSEALTLASRAFFNPGMLALLYFPAEHKYAVYTPLFASVAAPLVAALVREILAWKKSREDALLSQDETNKSFVHS